MGHIAWLGTGLLGSGFVEALLGRGERVRVWNRSADKARALAARGAEVAETPADAVAGASRVHLCLSDDAAVESVLAALLPALPPGVPVIDHTTVSPKGAHERQASLRASGISFLACPVFMGPVNARAGNGIMLCAASAELVERWSPELRKMTGELWLLGDDAKKPATIKLLGNALIISLAGTLADVMAIGAENGVTPEEALAACAKFPLGGILAGRGARMVAGDYAPAFELRMARKDLRLMTEAAGERELAVVRGLAARMDALVARGHGDEDLAVLAVDTIAPRRGAR